MKIMKKTFNKFFNKKYAANQEKLRIKNTILKYKKSITNEKIRSLIDSMPANAETLKTIEDSLSEFIQKAVDDEHAIGDNNKFRYALDKIADNDQQKTNNLLVGKFKA